MAENQNKETQTDNTPSVSNTGNPNVAQPKEKIDYNNEKTWVAPYDDTQLNIIRSRIIEEEKYRLLNDEEKKNYIVVPNEFTIDSIIKMLNDFSVLAYMLAPIFDVLKMMPDPSPLDALSKIVMMFNKILDLIAQIKTLEDVPIIGQLVKPLVEALRYIIEFALALFEFIIMLIDGTILAWYKIQNELPKIKEKLKKMVEDGETPDELQKKIDELEKELTSGEIITVFKDNKEVQKLLKELAQITKPIFDIYDMALNIVQKISQLIDVIKQFDPNSEDFTWNSLWKFIFGKSWADMKKEAQVKAAKAFKGGPLTVINKINEIVDSVTHDQYITKQDYEKLLQHKVALKRQKAEEKEKEKQNQQGVFEKIGFDFSNAWNNNKPTISK